MANCDEEQETCYVRSLVWTCSAVTQLCDGLILGLLPTVAEGEPTWRCRQNPFIGALRIQEPVILHEPQIKS